MPRVHVLATELEREPEDLLAVLNEGGGTYTAIHGLSPKQEAMLREKFAKSETDENQPEDSAPKTDPSPAPVSKSSLPVELAEAAGILVEVPEEEVDLEGAGLLEIDPSSPVLDERAVLEALIKPDFDEADEVAMYGLSAEEKEAVEKGLEVSPPYCRFALRTVDGLYRETLQVPPDVAVKMREALGGRKIADATYDPDRYRVTIVTYPECQEVIVYL